MQTDMADLAQPCATDGIDAGKRASGRRALVLGDDTRSFLAVVRSLGRAGWQVDAAPFDHASPALRSRYLRRTHHLPPYSLSADRWVENLRSLIAAEAYDLIVPCDDRASIPLQAHADAFAAAHLVLPNAQAAAVFFDKIATRHLAASLGVPIAPGKPLEAADTAYGLVAAFGLPLALKPRSSYTLGQAGGRSTVRIVRATGELAEALGAIGDRTGWLVEGFFDGEGCGLSVLADDGVIMLAFQHRRLAEASESGGSSSRIGEAIDPRLMAGVTAMARATALRGVAMFEFRRDPRTGRFILLEVNCRFWGSLPLAVASGVDFPAAAAQLYTGGDAPRSQGYRPGLVLRDVGGEYYRVLRAAAGRASPIAKGAAAATGLARFALDLARARGFDSHAPDDPAPLRGQRADLARTIAAAVAKRLTSPARRRARARAALARLRAAIADGRREIILLCHGNICRSPFAEHRLRDRAAAAGLDLHVSSAGTIARDGRSSPGDAVTAARRFGTDLSPHRSRFLDIALARQAASVVVFDDRNVDELRRLGLEGTVNVLRLPDLLGRHEIGDPYGHGPAAFDSAYDEIETAIERLVSALTPRGTAS